MKTVYDDDIFIWDTIYKHSYDGKVIGNNFDIKKPIYSDYRKRYVAEGLKILIFQV